MASFVPIGGGAGSSRPVAFVLPVLAACWRRQRQPRGCRRGLYRMRLACPLGVRQGKARKMRSAQQAREERRCQFSLRPSVSAPENGVMTDSCLLCPCTNNVQLAYILFILHGSAELKPRKQLHHCGFPLGARPLPSRPRPLKRRCLATLRSKRDVLPRCLDNLKNTATKCCDSVLAYNDPPAPVVAMWW